MTVPHHSEPAREAVARARQTARQLTERAIELSTNGRIPNDDADRMRIGGARLRELADLIASPAPAAGGLEAVAPPGFAVHDWEYTSPNTGLRTYAGTLCVASLLESEGVKLTPVYVRDEDAASPAATSAACQTCNGHGMIGGWSGGVASIDGGGGYVDEPCPHCTPAATSAETQGGDGVREALAWAMDEIDTLSNKLCQFAYPQGIAMVGRADQLPSYEAACSARRAALPPSTSAASVAAEPVAEDEAPINMAARAIAERRDAWKPGERVAPDYLKDASAAVHAYLAAVGEPAPAVESAQVKEGRSDG